MTSSKRVASSPDEAFVWVWLPGEAEPVVAGRLERQGRRLVFNYGQGYLRRENAIPLYDPELPLKPGVIKPRGRLALAGCLRDAAPDAWGRRVILNRLFGTGGRNADVDRLDELTYLLESGSDRAGALDFQRSPKDYVPRLAESASLEELQEAASRVEAGLPLPHGLGQALFHGTSLGGARPKALIEDQGKKYIAKFSSSGDAFSVVKGEFLAMRLAARAGLNVAQVRLTRAAGKDVLLVERFDRRSSPSGWSRRAMVSALTMLELDEMEARYASYQDFAEIIRRRFSAPKENLRELFGRMVFNVLCGNTDDHARNHSAFWDGKSLSLTPAYDICPQPRAGNEATQAMLILEEARWSNLALCLKAAPHFLLDAHAAERLISAQIEVIRDGWDDVCDEAELAPVDRALLRSRMFLNPFAFERATEGLARLSIRWG